MSAIRLAERLSLVVALAVALLCVGIGFGVGGLESRFSSASDKRGQLPPTRLTALPHRSIVDGTMPLRVRLSAPPASFSPRPTLSPAVAGTWTTHGDSELFTPASTLDPCADYTLTIPAASTAVAHSPLAKQRTVALSVQCPSVKGLQQTLARLGYLPYGEHSSSRARLFEAEVAQAQATGATTNATTTGQTAGEASDSATTAQASTSSYSAAHVERRVAAIDAFDPSPEAPEAHVSDAPPLEYGRLDETTKGALMVFQSEHEIEATGNPEAATWKALLRAAEKHERNPSPYTFVTVSESLPETLEVHRDDHVVFSTPANTGVPGAETAQGIFPIYSRFVSTTMTGTDVDGTKYTVPDVPWVNYFNGGDAVHGYPRASYGFPQSNGCVELPIEAAAQVYPMLKIGDIVEVS
ncbi:MAG TPA: L,D-transpeptidase family protein [Solirubrobacteraceae bacterium]|jgi:peptidoglycan hydrolase-like protein with peptidoglycan-binding domain|nr:L,D-transpeptidase family protein [Solirubrobacteraceae bacterium]